MNKQNNLSKSRRNYYVDIAIFLPFLLLLLSGIIMLGYHTGSPYSETIFNKDGYFWLNTHIILAIIASGTITIHLSFHVKWFKKLFSGQPKNKYWIRNLALFFLFSSTIITSVIPWLCLDESKTTSILLGVHNKIGLLLIVFFIIHLLSYFRWLTNMTKIVFGNKTMSNSNPMP